MTDASSPPDTTPAWSPPKSRAPLLAAIFLLLVAGGAAAYWYFVANAVHPDRLFVGVSTENLQKSGGIWWGASGRASAKFVDSLAKEFNKTGLDFVAAGDPKVLDSLSGMGTSEADVRAAAKKHGAAFAVFGVIRLVRADALGDDEVRDYTAEASLSLLSIDEPGGSTPLLGSPLRLHFTAGSEDEALLAFAAEFGKLAFSPTALALADTPAYQALDKSADSLDNKSLDLAAKLEPIHRAAKLFRGQLQVRADEEKRVLEQEAKADKGKYKKHLLGTVLDEEYFVGTTSGGEVVLMTEPHFLDLFRGKSTYDLRRGHEQLVAVGADGARKVLFEGYNIFSYPSVSADGRFAAMVLDHRQYSKALAIVDIGANTTRERLNVGDEYLSGPELSPKGKYVTAWRRSCRRCPSDLVAYDVASSDEGVVLRAANEDVSIGRPTWSADESRVYFSVDSSEMLSHIVAVTVPGAESAILLGQAQAAGAEPEDDLEDAQEDEPEPEDGAGTEDGAAPPAEPPSNEPAPSEYTYPEVSPDGRFLAVVESSLEDGRWLGVMELETKAYTRIFEGRAQWPRWSPDSSRIAFETWNTEDDADPMRRDVEVAVVPRTGGSATVLTLNDLDDSAMGWSRDSKRIYFHQGSRDPDGDAWTNRVYWVEP